MGRIGSCAAAAAAIDLEMFTKYEGNLSKYWVAAAAEAGGGEGERRRRDAWERYAFGKAAAASCQRGGVDNATHTLNGQRIEAASSWDRKDIVCAMHIGMNNNRTREDIMQYMHTANNKMQKCKMRSRKNRKELVTYDI